jgi:hypothetical protein
VHFRKRNKANAGAQRTSQDLVADAFRIDGQNAEATRDVELAAQRLCRHHSHGNLLTFLSFRNRL